MQEKETFNDLIERYDDALKEYGLSCATRLCLVTRANVIIRKHENHGSEQLDNTIIAAYFKGVNDRYYNGEIGKAHWHNVTREAERFLNFIKTGKVKLVNPNKGSRCAILPEFEQITNEFLESEGFHHNTRNDIRWAIHKYFMWLAKQGYKNLHGVGAEQIQKFLLYCTQNYAKGSVHDIKLYVTKLYSYLYKVGLSESSYQALLSFSVSRGTRIQPILQKEEVFRTCLVSTKNKRNKSNGSHLKIVES